MVMSVILFFIYPVIGLLLAVLACSAFGLALCMFVGLINILRFKWAWTLTLGYAAGSLICLTLAGGILYLVGTIGDHTGYKVQAVFFVSVIFPGIFAIKIIPQYLKIAAKQTRGRLAEKQEP